MYANEKKEQKKVDNMRGVLYIVVYHAVIIINCNLEKPKNVDFWLKFAAGVRVLLAKSLK